MKNILDIFKRKPTLIAIAKVDSIETKTSVGDVQGKKMKSVWYYVNLCFRMKGLPYSKIELCTTRDNVHTKFEAGKEYVIFIIPKDEVDKVHNLGLVVDQYGFYDKD